MSQQTHRTRLSLSSWSRSPNCNWTLGACLRVTADTRVDTNPSRLMFTGGSLQMQSTGTACVSTGNLAKTHHWPSRAGGPTADVLFELHVVEKLRLIALLLAAAATDSTWDAATSPPTLFAAAATAGKVGATTPPGRENRSPRTHPRWPRTETVRQRSGFTAAGGT